MEDHPPTDMQAQPQSAAEPNSAADQNLITDQQPEQQQMTDELKDKIVRQVEFYFSDANLPTDAFMLQQIKRSPDGFVPLQVIADFRKMKKLTKSLDAIVTALSSTTTSTLELNLSNPSHPLIRRTSPLPDINLDEVRRRTVIADNFQLSTHIQHNNDAPTVDYIMQQFSVAGEIVMVRIRKPNNNQQQQQEPLLTKGLTKEYGSGARNAAKTYALIEYKSVEEAVKAVALLHQPDNWRTGLRVRILLPPSSSSSSIGGIGSSGTGGGKPPVYNNVNQQQQQQQQQPTDSNKNEPPVALQRAHQPWQAKRRTTTTTTATSSSQHSSRNPSPDVSPNRNNNLSSSSLTGKERNQQQQQQHPYTGPPGLNSGTPGIDTAVSTMASTSSGIGGSENRKKQPSVVEPDGTRGFTFGRGKYMESGTGGGDHPLIGLIRGLQIKNNSNSNDRAPGSKNVNTNVGGGEEDEGGFFDNF